MIDGILIISVSFGYQLKSFYLIKINKKNKNKLIANGKSSNGNVYGTNNMQTE